MKPSSQPHIAILPSPGMGHLIPLVELAKKLVSGHRFSVTFIIPSDDSTTNSHVQSQKSFLQTLPHNINTIFLPPISLTDLPHDTKIESRISLTVNRSITHLHQTLNTLYNESNIRFKALVVDILGVCAIDLAKEHKIPPYIFFFSNAMALSLVLHLNKLDDAIKCEFKDFPEPIKLPGCISLEAKDLPDHIQDKTNETYRFSLEKSRKYHSAEGLIVNSFFDLEPGAFKALRDGKWCKVPVYPIGPLVQMGRTTSNSDHDCLKWLDDQPIGSVLYVSFGSGGTLSPDQLVELAFGLETSGKRFLWVVKSPDHDKPNAAFFNGENSMIDPLSFLPKGFLERTENKGFVVSSWAPQGRVLSHQSTGGFLTHCGWNSCLDGIVSGVPMIGWPLFAEQRMNAAFLSDGLKVSMRVEAGENGIVDRKQIAEMVTGLIGGDEGDKLGNRIRVVKDGAEKAWSSGIGSSEKALDELAKRWMQH